MTKTKFYACLFLAISYFALCAANGLSQTFSWTPSERYDQGQDTSLAIHASGLILDAHRTQTIGGRGLWYHLGIPNSTSVSWGGSQLFPWAGTWPNVAISKEGYVIFVYSTGDYKGDSDLYYAVGKIDPYGGTNQTIQWLTASTRWDSGFHSSIAITQTGVIVGVHESGSGGKGLYYRVGHLTNPNGGDYTIAWDSGEYGNWYDNGINPHIAINNLNQVVEVHQVTGENYLHYRRGNLSGGTITFGGSPQYSSDTEEPTVALLDNGSVREIDVYGNVYARSGMLNPHDPWTVNWDSIPLLLSNDDSDRGRYPALATNGTYALATWTSFSFDITGRLYYSITKLQ